MNDAVDRAEEPSALRGVEALVAAGARRSLIDVEPALTRMRTGDYGCCRVCAVSIRQNVGRHGEAAHPYRSRR